jgi:hypothetical protein
MVKMHNYKQWTIMMRVKANINKCRSATQTLCFKCKMKKMEMYSNLIKTDLLNQPLKRRAQGTQIILRLRRIRCLQQSPKTIHMVTDQKRQSVSLMLIKNKKVVKKYRRVVRKRLMTRAFRCQMFQSK